MGSTRGRFLSGMVAFVHDTCKHKYFIFIAGWRLGVPLRQLILHDLSKFTPAEFPHFVRRFYADGEDMAIFSIAMDIHHRRNPHHWEYWVEHPLGKPAVGTAREIPHHFILEMVADWLAAFRTYHRRWPSHANEWPWLMDHWDSIVLHPRTRNHVRALLEEMLTGFRDTFPVAQPA